MHKKLPDWNSSSVQSLQPFSKIKLIALDLDGTLIESNNSVIPKKIIELGRSLKTYKYKVMITLATGRTLLGISSLLGNIPILSNIPIIMYNGSIIAMNKSFEIIYKKTFPSTALKKILDVTLSYKVRTLAYFCNWFGEAKLNEYVMGWSRISCPEREYNKMPVAWQSSYEFDGSINPSIVVIDISEESQKIIKVLANELNNIHGISTSFGGTKYIEVRPHGINKGVALEYISKELKLSRHEILALGDNDNDSEMLSWAGIGVAVKNASQKARRSSNYICHFDAVQGAIQVMKLVREARKYFYQNMLKLTTNINIKA